MPCLLSATFIGKNRESLCPSDELVHTGTSSALATREHNIVQKLQLGYWNLSSFFFCIHACVKTRTCPSSCMPLKSPIHRSKILPPFRTRCFFCFVKPHSISHCIIVGLYLCRVSAVFSSFRLYVISVLSPCFCLCWRQGQWGLWLLSPNICFWASCKRENLFVFNLRTRVKDMKLPFAAAWGGGEVCDLLNKLIFVKTDSATKQNLPKQPEIPAFPINCLMLNVDIRWGICWMWHRNPKV